MARAKVWSETITHKDVWGGRRVTRYWCVRVHGWNGVVWSDDGYASQAAAMADANRFTAAVRVVEDRGHKLRPWRELVDKARGGA